MIPRAAAIAFALCAAALVGSTVREGCSSCCCALVQPPSLSSSSPWWLPRDEPSSRRQPTPARTGTHRRGLMADDWLAAANRLAGGGRMRPRSSRRFAGGGAVRCTFGGSNCATHDEPEREDPSRSGTTALSVPSLHTHEFWGKARTAQAIQEHVVASLHHHVTAATRSPAHPNNDVTSLAIPTVDVLSSDPPLVVIHDFLTQRDCEDIMDAAGGSANGLQRSTTGATQEVGTGRTSSTVWLKDGECQIPLRRIASMVSAVSGLPPSRMENLQVCKYLPGQEFKLHTDHQDSYNDLEWRGRLATCLIYLSSATEGMSNNDAGANGMSTQPRGGETWFPGVRNDADNASFDDDDDDGLSICPRQGSAVFFWNTLEKPGMQGYDPLMFLNTDTRLRHAGLPVLAGEKWICNRWVHPIDFGSGVRGV
jgi:prolyl 4-hydroxylase